MSLPALLLSAFLSIMPAQGIGPGSGPVMTSSSFEHVTSDSARLVFSFRMQKGWHVYSTDQKGGPTSAELSTDSIRGLELCGPMRFDGSVISRMDEMFGATVSYFENSVRFIQPVRVTSADWYIDGNLTYGACNDTQCLPPGHVEFVYSAASGAASGAASSRTETGEHDSDNTAAVTDLSALPDYDELTWKPVMYGSDSPAVGGGGLWGLFLTSLLGGLLALLTPCVWPVIPMTVSFFLKRSSDRRQAVRDAVLFGLSIVAIYVGLGLAITLIFGADALNSLATNAVVNLVFFAVLVAFALSFFGLFELRLPASWSTGTDRGARKSGFSGIFFMALTLATVSFSCTGPIIGFLLVDAAQNGSLVAPVAGMAGFSLALAIPFTLFALFPGWMSSMPKSGSWMSKVKVTLGFVELAFSLKFLSVADMAYGWGILPRELFILLWALMALVLSLYLLGIYEKGSQKKGPVSIVAGIVSLAFAAWLVPGLWGAPLKAISAFCPPASASIANRRHVSDRAAAISFADHDGLPDNASSPDITDLSDYSIALEASAETGRPVLIDFTGYGCVNCRRMEASVLTNPDVAKLISCNFILVSLYVDDRTPLKETITVVENGRKLKLRTVGDKWSLLQRFKFGANAQPFYVVVDAQGRLLSAPYTFNPDPSHFIGFLQGAANRQL